MTYMKMFDCLASVIEDTTSINEKSEVKRQAVVKFGHVTRALRSGDSKVAEDNGSDGNSLEPSRAGVHSSMIKTPISGEKSNRAIIGSFSKVILLY